jgi:hypothetical protein
MKRITLTVGLDVDHDMCEDELIDAVRDAIAENVALADTLRYTCDGVHIATARVSSDGSAAEKLLAQAGEWLEANHHVSAASGWELVNELHIALAGARDAMGSLQGGDRIGLQVDGRRVAEAHQRALSDQICGTKKLDEKCHQ